MPGVDGAERRTQPAQLDVVVHVHPLPYQEHSQRVLQCIKPRDERASSILTLSAPETEPVTFSFDKCYDESSTLGELFQNEVAPVVSQVFSGRNGTVLTYGARGAGKTFTMEGSKRDLDIVPRCLKKIFKVVEDRSACKVTVSYQQVHYGKVFDLLRPGNVKTGVEVQKRPDRPIGVQGLTKVRIQSLLEFTKLYDRGRVARNTDATGMSLVSSKSYRSLTVHVASKNANGEKRLGKLNFIDMEECDSTVSLFVLGKVMAVMNGKSENGLCSPARSNKFTQLMLDLIGDSCNTIMICNVSPLVTAHKDTLKMLELAVKSRRILCKARPIPIVSSVVINTPPKPEVVDLTTATTENPPRALNSIQVKRPSPSSVDSEVTRKARKVHDTVKSLMISPARAVANENTNNSDTTKLTMEEKLHQWKQAKNKCKVGPRRVNKDRESGANLLSTDGVKRKRPEEVTQSNALTPAVHGCSKLVAHKNPHVTGGNVCNISASSPKLAMTSRSISSAIKVKPRLSEVIRSDKPQVSSPKQLTSGGRPAMAKENRRDVFVSPNQLEPEPNAVVDKKPIPLAKDPQACALAQPRSPDDKKMELLAKDLVRVAIGFEKKHRFSTAFSIFKLAHHLLHEESTKLAERLTRLQHDHPAIAGHVPSQEFSPAAYMQQVLERDLMAALNDGSKSELVELHSIGGKRADLVLVIRPFDRLEDLQRVPGITANVIARLHEHHTNWQNHK